MGTDQVLDQNKIDEINRLRDYESADVYGGDRQGMERAKIYMACDLLDARAIRDGITVREYLMAVAQLRCEYFALLRPPEQIMKNYQRRAQPKKRDLDGFGSLRIRGLEHVKPEWWNLSYEPDRYEVAAQMTTDQGVLEWGRHGLALRVEKP